MYGSDSSTPLPALPSGLTVDVPGASGGFPAFSGTPFPTTPQAVTLTAPADGSVTSSTTFAWSSPSNDPNTLVLIGGVQPSPAASFVCFARDDGSFSFSSATQAQLATAGFTQGQLNHTGRFAVRTTVQGDAVLNTYILNLQPLAPTL